MRVAVYFAPPADDPLTKLAAGWLGRDAFSGRSTRAADPALDPHVADPARYGFHATMKAPFRLAEPHKLDDLDAALAGFCAMRRPFEVPLALTRLGSFFALTPAAPSESLDALAGSVVRVFEPFRAPLSEAEIARRRPERLTIRQRRHLEDWGYPLVFEDFRFHMTLTGSVADEVAEPLRARLADRFAAILARPLRIDGLALFVEDEPGAPFRVYSRHGLVAAAQASELPSHAV